MQDELTAIKKSLTRVDDMQASQETLNTQMATLITWQTEVVNPALQQVRSATEELSVLKPQVGGLMQWKTTAHQEIAQAQTKTDFQAWLDTEFLIVRTAAAEALPRSDFAKFLKEMEDMETRCPNEKDVVMERAGVSGKWHTREESEQEEECSPALATKRRHASRESTPTRPPNTRGPPPPLGAKAFAEMVFTPGSPSASSSTSSSKDKEKDKEFWRVLPPTEVSNWSPHAVNLLLNQWGATEMQRLEGWVQEHCGSEMNATIRDLKKIASSSPEFKSGLDAILSGPPMRIFQQPPCTGVRTIATLEQWPSATPRHTGNSRNTQHTHHTQNTQTH